VTPPAGAPLVFAHRGSSDELPEHTLDAYRRAIEQGADGLECDIRLTRDGHLVCIHDRRLDRTSNGRGPVSAATLADLDRLDFASWRAELARTDAEGRPGGVLTLDRLLATVVEAGRPLRMLIETKHPSRFGAEVEIQLVRLLERYGLAKGDAGGPVHVTVMSFSPLAVRRARELAPRLPTVFLFKVAPPWLRSAPKFGADILGPVIDLVRARPELVRRARKRGRPVYVWTVNTNDDFDLVRELGVEGIISDRPAFVLSRLGR
jgi:glycerophosphoryl diester phosphodiesterase